MDSVFTFGVVAVGVIVVIVVVGVVVVIIVGGGVVVTVSVVEGILKEGENEWNGIFGKADADRFPFGMMTDIFRDNCLLCVTATPTSSAASS